MFVGWVTLRSVSHRSLLKLWLIEDRSNPEAYTLSGTGFNLGGGLASLGSKRGSGSRGARENLARFEMLYSAQLCKYRDECNGSCVQQKVSTWLKMHPTPTSAGTDLSETLDTQHRAPPCSVNLPQKTPNKPNFCFLRSLPFIRHVLFMTPLHHMRRINFI